MIKNFRIGYYTVREDVCSTFYQKDSAERLAEHLHTVAPTWEDAKHFVHLAQWNMIDDHWGVDGYGDPLCTRISGKPNTENLEGLFLHMKGVWHYSDNGIDWDPITECFLEKVAQYNTCLQTVKCNVGDNIALFPMHLPSLQYAQLCYIVNITKAREKQ